jgi:cupin-like protein
MKIERRTRLNPEQFVNEHIVANKPVIITDAMSGWDARTKWNPGYLDEKLGGHDVQIYNNLFDLMKISTLHDYFARNFDRPSSDPSDEYVRWYTKLKDVDFVWADEAFAAIREDWNHPYFLPSSGFVVPFFPSTGKVSAVDERFPYKGLFISGAGARTRLHKDPWATDAVLCQFYGRKSLTIYAPDQSQYLESEGEFVDPLDPDLAKFPDFPKARPIFEDVLEPGEVLYIAGGWFHDVRSLSDSISVTWNFVHSGRLRAFHDFVESNPHDKELDIVRFFLASRLGAGSDADDILEFLKKHSMSMAAA